MTQGRHHSPTIPTIIPTITMTMMMQSLGKDARPSEITHNQTKQHDNHPKGTHGHNHKGIIYSL